MASLFTFLDIKIPTKIYLSALLETVTVIEEILEKKIDVKRFNIFPNFIKELVIQFIDENKNSEKKQKKLQNENYNNKSV